jgi:hypothetical protein
VHKSFVFGRVACLDPTTMYAPRGPPGQYDRMGPPGLRVRELPGPPILPGPPPAPVAPPAPVLPEIDREKVWKFGSLTWRYKRTAFSGVQVSFGHMIRHLYQLLLVLGATL